MSQRSSFGGLAIKALQHLLVGGEALGHGLDRYLAIQLTVKSAIDQAHAAATEKIDHLVLSNALYI